VERDARSEAPRVKWTDFVRRDTRAAGVASRACSNTNTTRACRPERGRSGAAPSNRHRKRPAVVALEQRVATFESDLGFVSLVLAALMARLDERGHVTNTEVKAVLDELDGLHCVKDGRLDLSVLRRTTR